MSTLGTTRLTVHPSMAVGEVDPRLFGGFLEHMGRAVYEGVYQPDSAHADEHGCRSDVLDALARLDMTVMRYPGGNFVSGYHWLDGVGPLEQRPTVTELAWKSIETNQFGTDEFLGLAERMGWTPMLAVNLGTGTPEEARNWLEYTNAPVGTRWADLRAEHGRVEPWGVPLWCLGNEMDGPWQLGHAPAEQYAIAAQQTAKMLKDLDPGIETVVCGSSMVDSPTYGTWDQTVVEHVGELADHLSLHNYANNLFGDTPAYLAYGLVVDRQIEQMDAICRAAQARTRAPRRPTLCFDEWNVWYRMFDTDGGWTHAPHMLEELYNLEDALVVAGFLNSFVRHADVVRIANLAQVANVIAPVLTRGDELLVQSIFHPFAMFSQRRAGTSLRVAVDGPTYGTLAHGDVAVIDASCILGADELHLFLVNRSTDSAAPIQLDVPGHVLSGAVRAELLTGERADAGNTWESPDVLVPVALSDQVVVDGGSARVELPPLSFAAISLGR